jgi:hypothetical protein
VDINKLIKNESEATLKCTKEYKSIVSMAIKKHGLNRDLVMEEIRLGLGKLSSDYTRLFMKMGLEWLK